MFGTAASLDCKAVDVSPLVARIIAGAIFALHGEAIGRRLPVPKAAGSDRPIRALE